MPKKLVEEIIAERLDVTAKEANNIFLCCLEALKESIQENKDLRIRNFGTFKTSYREERPGRNPLTGEAVLISARNVLRFKPSQELKQLIN